MGIPRPLLVGLAASLAGMALGCEPSGSTTTPRVAPASATRTDPRTGVKVRFIYPREPGTLVSGGHASRPAGTTRAWWTWRDGQGQSGRVDYEYDAMRLRVDGKNHGPIEPGDLVELDAGTVSVNGRVRKPVASGP